MNAPLLPICPDRTCRSTHIAKNGKNAHNRQQYKCVDCGRFFVDKVEKSRTPDPIYRIPPIGADYGNRLKTMANDRGISIREMVERLINSENVT